MRVCLGVFEGLGSCDLRLASLGGTYYWQSRPAVTPFLSGVSKAGNSDGASV